MTDASLILYGIKAWDTARITTKAFYINSLKRI